MAYASSLDVIGCFGSSVIDTAMLLSAISGHDRLDATSSKNVRTRSIHYTCFRVKKNPMQGSYHGKMSVMVPMSGQPMIFSINICNIGTIDQYYRVNIVSGTQNSILYCQYISKLADI